MALNADMDARLRRWAEWLKSGDGSGYSVMSTLHPDWSPPSPGTTPTMKTAVSGDGAQTARMVGLLSDRMRATVAAVYLLRMTAQEAGEALSCAADTVHDRIERVHRMLEGMLADTQSQCNIRPTR